jgi:hypothetical protein
LHSGRHNDEVQLYPYRFALTARRSLPVCPQLRTFSAPVGMSQTCQFRKFVAPSIARQTGVAFAD